MAAISSQGGACRFIHRTFMVGQVFSGAAGNFLLFPCEENGSCTQTLSLVDLDDHGAICFRVNTLLDAILLMVLGILNNKSDIFIYIRYSYPLIMKGIRIAPSRIATEEFEHGDRLRRSDHLIFKFCGGCLPPRGRLTQPLCSATKRLTYSTIIPLGGARELIS